MASTQNKSIASEWTEEENLMLLECWARDGYTGKDIANRIGISLSTLTAWRKMYPEIENALKKGREIIDYKVENALLKSALGYRTKEVKVTTVIRYGKVVENIKEVTEKDQAPNVSAIQCWLYNRLPNKWKKNRDKLFDEDTEDASIHITVTRAGDKEKQEDDEWQDEINESVNIRKATQEEIDESNKKALETNIESTVTKVEIEQDDDLDYWPDDWEDEDDEQ